MSAKFPHIAAANATAYRFANLFRHPGDPITRQLVPFQAYTMEIRKFLSMQISRHMKEQVARTLFSSGSPGGGKTEGAIYAVLAEGFSVAVTSASMFASEHENGAADILNELLAEMERYSAEHKRRMVLLVNDMHLSIMASSAKTGNTVNTGLLVDAFMNLADNRHLYRNFDGSNIAFVVTLNDGSKLPETMKRDGRAIRYAHNPSVEDKTNIAYAIFQPQTAAERDLMQKLTRKYSKQPVAFWKALKFKVQSVSAERVLRNGIPDAAVLDAHYGRRLHLDADLVWACAKDIRSSRIRNYLAKRNPFART